MEEVKEDVQLLPENVLILAKPRRDVFVEELKKLSYIAIPMVLVNVSQHMLRVVSMMMLGHISELSLSGAAIAISLTNVTGFGPLFGMASALETLCGQAYGAGQYHMIGAYTYGAIISLLFACIPISLLWLFMDKILILMGQDHAIAVEACTYSVWLIASTFPFAILQSLMRYLQMQSMMLPLLWSSVASLCFHLPLSWILIFKLRLGSGGAAFAIGLSYWFNVVLLVLYVRYSSSCEKSRGCLWRDVFPCMVEFLRLAFPSASMVCLEWWTFEIAILLAGLLPKPQLETSVLSICLMISFLHYFIPFSIGAGASTRISNELGAGNPEAAQMVVWTVIVLAVTEAIIGSLALMASSHIVGYAFSNEKEVVDYLTKMTPSLSLLLLSDGIQSVLSGIARGSGWQHLGAYVNLGAFYLVGIPLAAFLGFTLHLKGMGLWMGLNVGSIVQMVLLALITSLTDWQKQASKARERVFHGGNPLEIEIAELSSA